MTTQKNSKAVDVEYTETFKFTLSDMVNFLSESVEDPKQFIDKQLDEFEGVVKVFPTGCKISPVLLELGCSSYRECVTKDGYRILYSYDDQQSTVTTHVMLSKRQSVKELLFKRIISI